MEGKVTAVRRLIDRMSHPENSRMRTENLLYFKEGHGLEWRITLGLLHLVQEEARLQALNDVLDALGPDSSEVGTLCALISESERIIKSIEEELDDM